MACTILAIDANSGIGFYIDHAPASGKSDDKLIVPACSLEKAAVALDVKDDACIKAAEKTVRERCGKLDVTGPVSINNAVIAIMPSPRSTRCGRYTYGTIYDTNVSALPSSHPSSSGCSYVPKAEPECALPWTKPKSGFWEKLEGATECSTMAW
ncbi:hypothetical protein BKA93DRAFT_822331 [Sparassis latifolia]